MSTVERARGRWRDILPQLGLAQNHLVNKHGPCPLCGGRDRYRFDDRDGSGSYYCGQCGPGSGMTLAMKLLDVGFAEAANRIDGIIGLESPGRRERPAPVDDRDKRARALRQVLAEAGSHDVVTSYLQSRGLNLVPATLEGHPGLVYWDGERPVRYPALLAPVIDCAGNLQSAHRTYIVGADEFAGQRKKLMPAIETVTGAAIRLFGFDDILGLAEGIETAIAATELFDVPTWSTISAHGLETVQVSASVRRVHIFVDNDRNFTGQRAAFALAARLNNLAVEVHVPPKPGSDWLDVLLERRAR
ncbi:MAG: toprim domain-containing protein [Acidobacteria bacterium]|nr:toprim domain-containing protein [Acidobacteriota bacterium]